MARPNSQVGSPGAIERTALSPRAAIGAIAIPRTGKRAAIQRWVGFFIRQPAQTRPDARDEAAKLRLDVADAVADSGAGQAWSAPDLREQARNAA